MKQSLLKWFNSVSLGQRLAWALSLLLLLGSSHRALAQLSGAYTINSAQAASSTNFVSFTAAAAQLNTVGVNGPVTFTVSGGPYTEQIVLNAITGVSATNSVVFNGSGSTIQFSSSASTQRAVIQFNGATYTTLNNLNINTVGTGTYGWGVLLTNASDNNTIQNCTITADIAATSSNYVPVVVSGSATAINSAGNAANNLKLLNNTLVGGYYGLALYATSTTVPATGNQIVGNTIQDFYFYGIYAVYQSTTQIINNNISRPNRTNPSTFYGIYLSSGTGKQTIEKNRLHDPFGGAPTSSSSFYGIYTASTSGTAGNEVDIVNNVVYNVISTGYIYTLYNSGSAYNRYYNNTLSLDDATANTTSYTYGYYQSVAAANIEVKNNIISATRSGSGNRYALYFLSGSTNVSDYNDLYVGTGTNAYTGYNGTAYNTLAQWQAATGGFDIHSLQVNPGFVAPATGNLLPTAGPLNNLGTPLARVIDDITGAARSSTPDMGAYEFTPPQNDAAVTSIVNFAPYAAGTRSVVVNVLNNGVQPLTSLTLGYTLNGGPLIRRNFTGLSITTGQSTQLTLTGITLPTGTNTLVVTSSLPNGQIDDNPANDSQTLTNSTALNGPYTIDNTRSAGGTNFVSFTDAAAALNLGGVLGPVTFAVSGGPYTEQIILNEAPGVSATNSVIFNGGGNTIRFASNDPNQRAVIALNGADYYTFNNLVIDATGSTGTAGTYGWGVLLTNSSNFDSFIGCTITAEATQLSSNYAGVVVSGSASSISTAGDAANSLTLLNNTINGGYYAIALYGTSTTAYATGTKIIGNTLREFAAYGIYGGYQSNIQITGNDISRPTRVNVTTFYGIYLFSGGRTTIEKNRLHDMFTGAPTSTSSIYGIYLSTVVGASGSENDIINNLVYNANGAGTIYTLYNSGSPYSRYYNNTLSLDNASVNTTSTTYGYYQSTAATGIEVKNNIISLTRNSAGTGTKYALYFLSGSTNVSDYNDLYVGTGTGGAYYTGYNGTAYGTLAQWQAATGGFDAHSLQVDPVFINPNSGNYTPGNVALNNAGTPLARVTDDITGAARGSVPDIGAYEFTPVGIDLSPVALVSPTASAGCFSPTQAITVQVRNGGTAALNFATNAATVTVVVTLPGGTTQTLTATVNTGTLASGATQNVTLTGSFNMAPLGTYGFAVTATVVGDANTSNDVLTPAPSITVVAPVAGIVTPGSSSICTSGTATLTVTGAANGSIQWQSSPSATGTFTDIAGATSATYTTPVITTTTYYRAQVRCNTNTATSNVSTITVNTPLVATTNTPVSICAGSTATLTATASAGSSIRFFSAATGGTALTSATPGSYTTPALTANTTYYAEAYTGGTENVGPTTQTSTGLTAQTGGALYFTATKPVLIQSVMVFLAAGQAAGTVTIELRTGNSLTGALVNNQSTAFAVPANTTSSVASYVIPINYTVPAAGAYTLYLPTASQGGLLRDNGGTNTTAYPFTSPSGSISITASNLSTYYYYFYNWVLGGECVATPRTAVQVNVTPAPTAGFSYATGGSCIGTAATLTPTLATGATAGTFSLPAATGLSIDAITGVVTVGATAAAGTYTVTNTVAASGNCGPVTSTATFSIAAPTTATFSYPAGPYCVSGTTNPTPTITGTAGGTFSSTTGLTINATTGVITLSSSTAGTYTVTYTVGGGCGSSSTQSVIINAPPTAAFSYPATAVCAGTTATKTPTLATGATTGTFSLPAATGLTLNAATGVVTIGATATAGTYTVTNTVAAANGCAAVTSTASFTITPQTTATFSYAGSPFCNTGTNPTPSITGTAGGTFSSTTGLTISATTGVITLSSSTAGTYTVTYTVAGACGSSSTQSVTITAPQTAGFTYATATTCAGSAATLTPTLATGATAGTFSLPAATGISVNATTGAITVGSGSVAGTYTVTNTVAASGGCAAIISTASFTLTPAIAATFSYAGSPYCTTGTNPTPTITGTAGGTFSATTGLTLNATTGVITLSSSTPGTYTVTYTVAGTCGSSSTQTVTITAPQTASFSYATPTTGGACAGGTGTFTATLASGSTAGTFTASPATGLNLNATTGAISLANSTAGTYTITNTVAAGACAGATATTTFTVNPVPATPTLTVSGTPATGITLTSSSTTGNQFYLGGVAVTGATGQSYLINSGTKNGSYTVTVTNASGCSATSAAVTVTVTGTTQAAPGTSLSVVPNPTSGSITLTLTNVSKTSELVLLNALGQQVLTRSLSATAVQAPVALDLSGLATGVYLLRVSNADGVLTKRLVRE